MKNMKDKIIGIVIYFYSVLPTLIFILGWFEWYWAFIFGVLILTACFKSINVSSQDSCFITQDFNMKVTLIVLLIVAVWVYLSGIGGYCFQNKDHRVRNSIFNILVEYNWPVVSTDGSRGLIYYIGFWLPAACIGKVFGLEAGYFFQAIWAILGIFCIYYLICIYRKKWDLLPIIFMIFFSGLDYVGIWLLGKDGMDLILASHIEWWAADFQFSSMTTQLFWVFNQALPAWLATILILNQKNCKNILFILSLIMLQSTFPFVGLIPIVIYLYIKRIIADKNNWKEIFTFQNIVGVIVVGGSVFFYLLGSVSGTKLAVDNAKSMLTEPAAQGMRYALFYLLEFGIYLCFIFRYKKRDPLVYVIVGILLICPFIKVGSSHDFCMRVSIPALFILMIMCIEGLEKIYRDKKIYTLVVFSILLLLGAITPFNEIHRSVKETFLRATDGRSVRSEAVNAEDIFHGDNFSGNLQNNLFYKYLSKW